MARGIIALILPVLVVPMYASAVRKSSQLVCEHANQLEITTIDGKYVTFVVGEVVFRTETGYIYCDSAVSTRGESADLRGSVFIDDKDYLLKADSVFYDLITDVAVARGRHVELWSYRDSLYASGHHAYFDDANRYFYMEERPLLYLNYPDSGRMVEVLADYVEYNGIERRAEAWGTVEISSKDIASSSDCAVAMLDDNTLDLYDEPSVARGNSTLYGDLIAIYFTENALDHIEVIDSARGVFKEPIDSAGARFDKSILTGKRIDLNFHQGELDNVVCRGQAYSWYYPSSRGSSEFHQNTVSGDTIRFAVEDESLREVRVLGGAIGTFLSGKLAAEDDSTAFMIEDTLFQDEAMAVRSIDTVDYSASEIQYRLYDSTILLRTSCRVSSGDMSLEAHEVSFDTEDRMITAYSAAVESDSTEDDPYSYAEELQPNTIAVMLRDAEDELFGDYLEYSIDTEKGRFVQSKSSYEAGYYYGDKLFRERKEVYYVRDGLYTTCDLAEPHFHFRSSHMKLIEGEKLIARPVVLYFGRLPMMAIPYYVFPLKRGRHSGFLTFRLGNFERGDRFIRDVGYFWAPSDYWDCLGSVDYFERNRTISFNGEVHVKKLYVLDGYVSTSYTRVTDYDPGIAGEVKQNRWRLDARYNHVFSPSFDIKASGSFQSDESYYNDYSINLDERLNRQVKSQASFAKRFGKSISLTGSFSHDVNLDSERRSDMVPSMGLSLPTIWPFGSGTRDEAGDLIQKWYHGFSLTYRPSLVNVSTGAPKEILLDTALVIDTTLDPPDTSYVPRYDTARTYRRYTRISHNPSLNLPKMTLLKYINLVPSISYAETWIKIHPTDQSEEANIDASRLYRTYSWGTSASLTTTVYGTVYPRLFGLEGLRHVLKPSLGYGFTPDINLHPEERAYAGGGAGSSKSSRMSLSLSQVFLAKVRHGESEKSLELFSLASSAGYDFENQERPLSNLSTSFQSNVLPNITFSGRMTHTLYKPGTDDIDVFNPTLTAFDVNASFRLAGRRFLTDDPLRPTDVDTAASGLAKRSDGGWSLSASYSYSESGLAQNWRKTGHFIQLGLTFMLTPSTSVSYNQRYDITSGKTINSSVNIVRTIHCWTGSLFWVPIGSNRGFGFKLYVTALPELKIDNSHDSYLQSVQQRYQ